MKKAGRNDPCPCGSGKKYKKCCLAKSAAQETSPRPMTFEEIGADVEQIDALSNQVPDLLAQGRVKEAEEIALRLLAEYPQDPDGLERMAEVFEAKGESKQAAAYYRRAAHHHLDADPDDGQEPAEYYLAQAERLDPQGPDGPGTPGTQTGAG